MFNSKYCEQWGFKAVKFKSTFKDNQTFFEGILKSQDNGTLLCEGVVKNIKLEAIFTWTRKFLFWEIKNEYWFRGEEILKVK
ncbi:MAG: hypothetical protein COA66_10215 [Arcobacter sp.]|nr:MAG: hypothetical protein COA66_10215 [Arcobacter sp.]